METFSKICFGTLSIRSLASFNPKEVKLRTTLITVIRLAAGTSFITTLNSVFSSATLSSIFGFVAVCILESLPDVTFEIVASTPKVCSN